MLAEILRPLIRFLVGFVAIPLFRLFVKRLWKEEDLSRELIKDLEQWFRGALLLLLATRNFELLLLVYLAGKTEMPLEDLQSEWGWVSMAMRLLLAIGVIQSMPDQDLFSIIHVGSFKLSFPKENRFGALRQQAWPLVKSIVCRHLDRSSSVFAILAVVLPPGRTVWICYSLACIQFLIIGLVSSRDKALDVLAQFDSEIHRRRLELERERQAQQEAAAREAAGLPEPPPPPFLRHSRPPCPFCPPRRSSTTEGKTSLPPPADPNPRTIFSAARIAQQIPAVLRIALRGREQRDRPAPGAPALARRRCDEPLGLVGPAPGEPAPARRRATNPRAW